MEWDCPLDVGINVECHREGRSMDIFTPSEQENIGQAPRRKAKRADAEPPKLTLNDLTCNEGDVDRLLSAGELT
jgi:hypothetical protein